MATPYIKNDGVNYKVQAGLPAGGVDTLQFTDSASSFTQTVPAATGTLALTTIATGVNAVVTTDMAAAYRALDGLVMPNVKGYLTNTPPGSPSDGDCYIIGAAPTGVWAGQASKVTRYSGALAAWEFYTAKNGWSLQANTARETYRFTASAWEIYYQEGTWTPTANSVTTTGSPTYSARYTKIGRKVTHLLLIVPSGGTVATTAGTSFFSGMPFTVANSFPAIVGDSAVGPYNTALVSSTNFFMPTMSASSNNRFATATHDI